MKFLGFKVKHYCYLFAGREVREDLVKVGKSSRPEDARSKVIRVSVLQRSKKGESVALPTLNVFTTE
jgi:hypothetical protein